MAPRSTQTPVVLNVYDLVDANDYIARAWVLHASLLRFTALGALWGALWAPRRPANARSCCELTERSAGRRHLPQRRRDRRRGVLVREWRGRLRFRAQAGAGCGQWSPWEPF